MSKKRKILIFPFFALRLAEGFAKDTLAPRCNRAAATCGTACFSFLMAKDPVSGAMRCLNVGRTLYPSERFTGNAESRWSPELETMSFHEPECFGEIPFE